MSHKFLFKLTDADVGSDTLFPTDFKRRNAARTLLFDEDGYIALCHVDKGNYHKLPGGGIEVGEDIEEGLRREVIEEAGCVIKNIHDIGFSEEFRSRFSQLQISFMHRAEVSGEKGIPQYDEGEQSLGFSLKWVKPEEGFKQLQEDAQKAQAYEIKFMTMRDSKLLEIALNEES